MGDEHLPADALARSFVEGIVDQADDLDIELGFGPDSVAEMAADGALIAEEVAGEAAVHDRYFGVLLGVRSSKSRPSWRGIPMVAK